MISIDLVKFFLPICFVNSKKLYSLLKPIMLSTSSGLIISLGEELILSLSILVVLHELGHFIPAKLFKTRVEKFYLFFDVWFSLFKKKSVII